MREPVDPIAIDTETTGLRPYQGDKPTMASFADGRGAWALPPTEAGDEIRAAVEAGRTIVMHNSIFDRAVFESAYGIRIPDDQVWDTMAVDWLLDENADHRLKEGLGARLFGVDASLEKKALQKLMRGRTQAEVYKELRAELPPRGEPGYESATETRARAKVIAEESTRSWEDLGYDDAVFRDYAIQDAALTWRIFHHQKNELREDPYPVPYFDQAHKVAGLAARMNSEGIRVSEEKAVASLDKVQKRIAELEASFEGTNLKAPAQVADLVYKKWGLPCHQKTATGAPSTAKDALESLSYDPRVAELLEFRALAKQVDAYYLPLLDRLGPDGRIHPTLHPFRTVTGRWSCSGPNLQTIPRESTAAAIRDVFIPADGLILTEWDLSQIEVRIAAAMSKEPALLEVYRRKGDVYQALADEIDVERHVAKTVILSAQYGVGPRTLAKTLAKGTGQKPDTAFARSVLGKYWAAYPRLERLMHGLEERAKRRGYLPLWKPGRRRLFKSPNNPYPRWYTALNASIQGGAAEFLKDVLLELEVAAADYGHIVLTVHDSVIIEHTPGAEPYIDHLLETITRDVSPYAIETPWERKRW